jgi:hypothetical protein
MHLFLCTFFFLTLGGVVECMHCFERDDS